LCFSRSSSSSSCVVASLFCFFFFLLVLLRHAQIELSQAHTYMVLLGCSFSLEKKQFPFFFCSDVPDGVCLFLSEYRTLFLSPFLSTCRRILGRLPFAIPHEPQVVPNWFVRARFPPVQQNGSCYSSGGVSWKRN
jgi:hypothetical protein